MIRFGWGIEIDGGDRLGKYGNTIVFTDEVELGENEINIIVDKFKVELQQVVDFRNNNKDFVFVPEYIKSQPQVDRPKNGELSDVDVSVESDNELTGENKL